MLSLVFLDHPVMIKLLSLVHLEIQAHLEAMVLQDQMVLMDLLVMMEKEVTQALWALPVHPDPLVTIY